MENLIIDPFPLIFKTGSIYEDNKNIRVNMDNRINGVYTTKGITVGFSIHFLKDFSIINLERRR